MDSNRSLPPEIEQALARGWTILTANQRAARTLRRDFDLRQRALNLAYWQPPSVLAWDTWLNGLWHSLLLNGHAFDLLLSPTQERTLWREVVAADAAAASLQSADALAQTAADAWLLLNAYQGRRHLFNYEGNSDTQTFRRWAAKFEDRCKRNRYLTQPQLPELLANAIAAGQLALPAGILLVGFDSRTPAQAALLQALRAAGTDIAELEPQGPGVPSLPHSSESGATGVNLTLASAPDEHAELAACAGWLRARLTQQPDARIAVILPAIEPARSEVDRVFRQVLAPELNDIAVPAVSGPYEFSLGVPLATTPLAATAFDLLHWAAGPLALDRVSELLLSPHFAADEAEYLARAEFDAFVLRDRHLLQPRISLDALAALASHPGRRLPVLLNHLRALSTLVRRLDLAAERTYADWAATIHKLLQAAGWAPPALLDSVQFQARRKWESALDELATLDFAGVRVRFTEALAALERIAAETLFAPESRHAPVQIMGPLESAGSSFDAIWFLRANDQAWPARHAPNPLLAWPLQRDLGMPGATPSLDAAHARRVTERIACSAPVIVFSYAQASIDGPLRRSPVLAGLPLEPRSALDLAPAMPAPPRIVLDIFADASPIPPPPDRVHQGGAAILQSQAACGFRAFAEKRLYSSALEAPSLGLDPRERGSLVHAVLENFWDEVKTQATLKDLTSDERNSQLGRSIDKALAELHARPEPGWPGAYLDAERHRLLTLLGQWLDYEATERKPFTVQSLEEKLVDVSIGKLRLAVRVDRVDSIHGEDNTGQPSSEIIFDYKTGASAPKDWLGPRPDAPQLPLYAVVANKPNLAAIAFASVRPGNLMGIDGYQAQPRVLPKASKLKTPSLAAQVDEWRQVLTSLADEFHAGNASVSPKHYPQTCEYCEQRLLCRLNPSTIDPDALEEIEDEPDPFGGSEEDELV